MSIRIDLSKGLLLFMVPVYLLRPAAPTPDFVVYYAQGPVVKMNSPKKGVLKKGDSLYSKDMLGLGPRSQVILICGNHHAIKLDKPDTVRMASLLARCADDKSFFLVAYGRFIWDELTGQTPDPRDYFHNIGAVSRGARMDRMPFAIDTINYLRGDLKVMLNTRAASVQLMAFDSPTQGNPLVTMNVRSGGFHLDSLASGLKAPGTYYWNATGLRLPRKNRCYLRIWQKKAYDNAVDSLLKTVLKTEPAETAYMAGFILEKNGFLLEAAKHYQLANKLDPENKIYRSTYSRFL